MDIEEIEDNSSQEDLPTATKASTKKRPKRKKEPPAAASSTLTRFLGPAGPPSLSAWEDVNRRCPVCQQTGFSSRSLALHVNECLDVGSTAGPRAVPADEEGGDASAKERAGGRNALTAGSARGAAKVGAGSASHAADAGSRQGEAVSRAAPQAIVPSKSKASDTDSNGKAAKKAKTQQDGRVRGAAAERQGQKPGAFVVLRLL